MAFDGVNLYITRVDDSNIYQIGPPLPTGAVVTIPIPGGDPRVSAGGPLAWDGSALWTVDYSGTLTLYKVDPTSGATLFSCSIPTANPGSPALPGLDHPDGLHWTGIPGSELVISGEIGLPTAVALVNAATCGITSFFNFPASPATCCSGVAFDGQSLWHATDGAMTVFQTDLSGAPAGVSFADPEIIGFEDLEFDPITFAPACALWGTTAGTPTVAAYEIPCTKPVAQCKNVTVPTDPGLCSAPASVNNGSYDPDGDPITLTQAPPSPYGLGATSVTLTASDPAGQSSSCTATVTVVDRERPSITCPAPITVECAGPAGATATFAPTFTDNCPVVTASCSPASGSTFPVGSTPVVCTATDASGNTNACNTAVRVVDTRAPVVTCVESVNPSGGNIPPAGSTTLPGAKGGQNEDGFYKITATDVCTASPVIQIGGFALASGETIKITQSPGASGVRLVNTMGPENIKHFQVGPGDAVITVTDGSGNVGTVACLVPPPPK
jgi:hypothetical protein